MIKTSEEQFQQWLNSEEDESLEFKQAKNQFDNSKGSLFDYCAAFANGSGGKLILGVQERPRAIVGTYFKQGTHNGLAQEIWQRIYIHVDVEEFSYQGKRILIFHIPKHPAGRRIKSGGKGDKYVYPIRRGESLGEMDDQKTREILNEAQPDFTAGIVPGLSFDDLDVAAIEAFRKKWAKESKRGEYLSFDHKKILENSGLAEDNGIAYAGLILVGKSEAIRRYLPDAEIIFEWRHDSKQTHYDFRKNWRAPIANVDDEIWDTINARNLRIPFQEGFFQREVWAFDEKSIREAVHNAVMHRDYSIKGRSIFIKASPQEFFIESPGGFPAGITLENILRKKEWRNRLLAEAFEKIGFAERSSQGLDDIFEKSIRDGKGMPDLSRSDGDTVCLSIPAQVKDENFILYLERVADESQINLSFEEIYELERIREGQKMNVPEFKDKFLKAGIVEMVGKGRGTRYILSHRYYEKIGKSGKHTRIKGLTRDQIKELILNHLRDGKPSSRKDLLSGFPECFPQDISNILQELRRLGKIIPIGNTRNSLWKIAD